MFCRTFGAEPPYGGLGMQQNVAAADVIIAWFFVSLFYVFGNDVVKYCGWVWCGVKRDILFVGGFLSTRYR